MSKSSDFINLVSETLKSLDEEAGRTVRKQVVRDGKRQIIKTKEYSKDCPDGYKRQDGRCVRMSPEEVRNRSKAAKKSSNKSSTKLHRKKSLRRRSSLID